MWLHLSLSFIPLTIPVQFFLSFSLILTISLNFGFGQLTCLSRKFSYSLQFKILYTRIPNISFTTRTCTQGNNSTRPRPDVTSLSAVAAKVTTSKTTPPIYGFQRGQTAASPRPVPYPPGPPFLGLEMDETKPLRSLYVTADTLPSSPPISISPGSSDTQYEVYV